MPEYRIEGPLPKIAFLAAYVFFQNKRATYHFNRANAAAERNRKHHDKLRKVYDDMVHRINAG